MKKITILCAAFAMAALGLTSCQKNEDFSHKKIIATFEQASNGKVSLDANLQMYWEDDSEYDFESSMIGIVTLNEFGGLDQQSTYYPTSISDDGKTAVLEYCDEWGGFVPFSEGTQGPFYAGTNAINWGNMSLNDDGTLHLCVFRLNRISSQSYCMPMFARADDLGELHFKHVCGVLKIIVSLPDGSGLPSGLTISSIDAQNNEAMLNQCDVAFDAQGNITLSNQIFYSKTYSVPCAQGNGFYYCAVAPGDIHNLQFTLNTSDGRFVKTMAAGAAIHVERAGITTVTLNFTAADQLL